MQDPKTQLSEILEVLTNRVMLLDTILYILKCLYDSQRDKRIEVLNFAVGFFVPVRQALHQYAILELSKLFDKREHRSLRYYVEQVKTHFRTLEIDREYFTLKLVESQLEEIDAAQSTIENLITQRDKVYAHSDSKYFGKETNLHKDAPLSVGDLSQLVDLAKKIVESHYLAFHDTQLPIRILGTEDVDDLIQAIQRYRHWLQDDEIAQLVLKKEYGLD